MDNTKDYVIIDVDQDDSSDIYEPVCRPAAEEIDSDVSWGSEFGSEDSFVDLVEAQDGHPVSPIALKIEERHTNEVHRSICHKIENSWSCRLNYFSIVVLSVLLHTVMMSDTMVLKADIICYVHVCRYLQNQRYLIRLLLVLVVEKEKLLLKKQARTPVLKSL